ncbi:MAG: hypothetical protein UU74_C0033G0026 [Candidatus Woesebacteria bacterium GW2011_GWA1_41_7]|uniref:Uncharacterized protein n=1 Tax=Candidatus Woesebacteria bacterium GW2011_GWA1_41_7 TaxID=1618556 RepID=A0A0G0WVL3_9BACT|nr:MAG: hypothetical protein UU74_C0033G0026 [Candidatus Woesebacteria bacterium GW2011_GWA1_41_7]
MKIAYSVRDLMVLAAAEAINGNVIRCYGSPTSEAAADALIPATPEASIGAATLLCIISAGGDGTGVNMATVPVNGVLAKDPAESWWGTMLASGYFSFYRISATADTGGASDTEPRLQGTIGVIGADFIVSNRFKSIGEKQEMNAFYIGEPAE